MLLRSSIVALIIGTLAALATAGCAVTAVPTHELMWAPVEPAVPAQPGPPAEDPPS